ncbi:MAG: metal-dependent hydrolase [Candidatus Thermoplasmatota archaeon]|nr:metal-dependent hydrolase [Candidatus Thermoplasmatota archaeon]
MHLLLSAFFISTLYLLLLSTDKSIPHLPPFRSGTYTLSIAPIPMVVAGVFVALYGSILPDIDTVKSKVFLFTILALLALCCCALLIGEKALFSLAVFLILLIVVLVILGHRKITHRPVFALAYGALAGIIFFDFYVAIFAFVGWSSHLVGDKIAGKK